ncbi:glyoxalase [Streptomyces sp. J2-1]|uniref:VOC family protein n=1 Tax=Streptomyces corallincola TaxID=2851888 RepID=UPI001C38C26F|nr:VOC family protein [Streptomyces corallincola]MBV2353514.1 glyoxalase [Streptomyces corallincola]
MYQQMIFVNLVTSDVPATRRFVTELGWTVNERFSTEECVSAVISDTVVAMFMTREHYARFTDKEVVDSAKASEVLLCLSAESRAKVDELVERAIAAGGTAHGDTQDQGFMYGRGFDDLDGHSWEVVWMDPAVAEG